MPKLTPAQQAVVDKMARGAVAQIKRNVALVGCSVVSWPTIFSLFRKGIMGGSRLEPTTGNYEYYLTPLGLSLARKDGENG